MVSARDATSAAYTPTWSAAHPPRKLSSSPPKGPKQASRSARGAAHANGKASQSSYLGASHPVAAGRTGERVRLPCSPRSIAVPPLEAGGIQAVGAEEEAGAAGAAGAAGLVEAVEVVGVAGVA